MPREIGERVGAILKADKEQVWFLGFGVYEGWKLPPPELGVTFMGFPAEHESPQIRLDSGDLVFGCECWWGGEAAVGKQLDGKTVIETDIKRARQEAADKAREETPE